MNVLRNESCARKFRKMHTKSEKDMRIFVLSFLYPATLKSAGYYVIPSIQKFAFECLSVRPSVRLSVRLSVRQHFVSALYLEHFLTDFLQTL